MNEKSHQIKHWLTDHRELATPPAFRYKLIQSFQDPMSRQLAEAVRIDLRGPNVLNSKTEYNRFKVPRLRVDLEEWKANKEQEKSNHVEGHHQELEAENSLQESDFKRKPEEILKSRPKRMRLEPLIGWGDNSNQDIENEIEEAHETVESFPAGWSLNKDPERADEVKAGEMVQMMLPDGWKTEDQNPAHDGSYNISTTVQVKDKMILSTTGGKRKIHLETAQEFRFKKKGKLSTREIQELKKILTEV